MFVSSILFQDQSILVFQFLTTYFFYDGLKLLFCDLKKNIIKHLGLIYKMFKAQNFGRMKWHKNEMQ